MGPVTALPHQSGAAFSDQWDSENGLPDRVSQLLDGIDCRLADTDEQREEIFRLRYHAYLREGGISPNPSRTFSDRYDETGNVYLYGLYVDSQLASSIRIHVASKEHPNFPAQEVFADFLQPELDAGKVLIDSTRFVTDKKLARIHRALPYATLRLSVMAAQYFGADYLLATVRAEHQAFYRRRFHYQLMCEPRRYPMLAKPICLMTLHYPTHANEGLRQYPFFRSTFFERRMLFERWRVPSRSINGPNQSGSAQDSPRMSGVG
jgi:N-acyl-L-homoserine lactone synthetase